MSIKERNIKTLDCQNLYLKVLVIDAEALIFQIFKPQCKSVNILIVNRHKILILSCLMLKYRIAIVFILELDQTKAYICKNRLLKHWVMDNFIVNRYIRMFESLDVEVKLELLSKLSESIKSSFKKSNENKNDLLEELAGSWSDIDDGIVDEIYRSRTMSTREISLD